MLKITIQEALTAATPQFNELLNDVNRRFPAKFTFSFALAAPTINEAVEAFSKAERALVETHNGTVIDGKLEFTSKDSKRSYIAERTELLNETIDLPIEKIPYGDNWPNLTLNETFALRPFVDISILTD